MCNLNPKHKEGARSTEEETAKLPSDIFLWASLGSMALSLTAHIAAKKHTNLFLDNEQLLF